MAFDRFISERFERFMTSQYCMNPHCRLKRQRTELDLVCVDCWNLLPSAWRHWIPRLRNHIMQDIWKSNVRWFFELTVLPMPAIKVLPARPWVEDKPMSEWSWAEFEIKLMQRVHAEIQREEDLLNSTDIRIQHSRIVCAEMKETMLEQYQYEAAEAIKQELTRDIA